MFRGRSLLRLDEKGRVIIPARFREILNVRHGGALVLGQGFFPEFPHLLLVPLDVWEVFEAGFGGSDLFDSSLDGFLARLRTMGGCEEVRLDEHGRILVPVAYRQYAGLDGEVACVGMGRYIGLWSLGTLESAMKGAERNLEAVRRQLGRVVDRDPQRSTGP